MHSKTEKEKETERLNNMTLEEQYQYYVNIGLAKKDIIKKIAKNNYSEYIRWIPNNKEEGLKWYEINKQGEIKPQHKEK